MSDSWPPLDLHAHIEPTIVPHELVALRAIVFAATQSLHEFRKVASRDDAVTVWGVGTHPRVPSAVSSFNVREFRKSIARTPLVSEVGLDARSAVSMSDQRRVLDDILSVLCESPRVISIHSAGATAEILDALASRTPTGIVLHWWRGTARETEAAIELGAWFSINTAELRQPVVLGKVPLDRILTETDHPFGDRQIPGHQPGQVAAIERAIATAHSTSADVVRKELWRNLARLVDATSTSPLLPDRIRRVLSAAKHPIRSHDN